VTTPGKGVGGLPPRRIDQQPVPPAAAVQPGAASTLRARTVIISGSGAGVGVFVYDGAPGAGNPPVVSITSASADPYGNAVEPGLEVSEGLILFYSGAPAAGNLATSIASTAGTDAYGNSYPLGLSVGDPAGPQVQLLPMASIPVTTSMWSTSAAATDVAGISNLQQIVTFPSNSATEAQPALIGTVLVTYTNGSVADALLVLAGLPSGSYDTIGFSMYLSQSSDGSKQATVLHGVFAYSAGTVVLTPTMAEISSAAPFGALAFYVAGQGPAMLEGTGTLIPPLASWTAFNPLSNGWAVGGSYTSAVVRLVASPRNCIQFDAEFDCASATTTDGTLVATLPAQFRPAQAKTIVGWTDVQRVSSGSNNEGVRFSLDTGGALRCYGIAGAATIAGISGELVPLDAN
jgi:hypothetical protein